MQDYIQLSYWQLGIAVSLVFINGLISFVLQLKLEKSLLIASVRTTLQLLLIGLILNWVFKFDEWYIVVALMLVMTAMAGVFAVERNTHRYPFMLLNSFASIFASSWIITLVAIKAIIQVDPWYTPQYIIPILGMVLGNTLTGIALGLDRLNSDLLNKHQYVNAMLALGATRWEAARPFLQQSLRAAMTPTINAMMAVGIVNLPGMMTGQLLAGVDPIQAVKYQIVIMFLIASGTGLGSAGAVLLTYLRLFNVRHQFLRHLILNRHKDI